MSDVLQDATVKAFLDSEWQSAHTYRQREIASAVEEFAEEHDLCTESASVAEGLRDEIVDLQGEVDDLEDKVDELEGDVETLKDRVKELEAELAEANGE